MPSWKLGRLPGGLPKTESLLWEEMERGVVRRLFDSVFKFVFCREERRDVFLDLANAFVFPDGKGRFKDVRFIDREHSPQRWGGKSGRFDVLAVMDG